MFGHLEFEDYKADKRYRLEVNAYHVRIYQIRPDTTNSLVYKRTPNQDEWLDETHLALTALLGRLEEHLVAAARG